MDQPAPANPVPPLPEFVPPTRPGVLSSNRPPVWPTTIAVFGLIFGTMAVIGSLINAASPLMKDFFEGMVPQGSGAFDFMDQHRVLWFVYQGLYAVCAVLLVVASVFLLRRSARSAALFRAWAILRLPSIVLGVYYTHVAQQAQLAMMKQNPQGPPGVAAITSSVASFFTQATLVGMGAWWLAQAGFVLWWFARPNVKADIARWFRA